MSRKTLHIDAIQNELENGSAFFPSRTPSSPAPIEKQKPASTPTRRLEKATSTPSSAQSTNPASRRSAAQAINRPVAQAVNRPVDPSVDQQLTGKVVDRPVAFYLPEVINQQIDEAVAYIEKRHHTKVDRSALVSAILGNPALWEPGALNELVDKAVRQLTSRLTSRLTR